MGAQSFARGAEVPPQPPTWSSSGSKPRKDDFSSAYAPVTNGAGSSRNPFEVYDADLDDAGADTGTWEAEAVGARSEARPWQPRFYSSYFDVNVGDICARLVRSIIPFKPLLGWAARDEEEDNGTSVPDLYGPVWVTTTAVLALSVGSSVAHFLSNLFHGTEANDLPGSLAGLDFSRLWRAASVLYFYVFVFPIILTVFQCLFVRRSLRESSVASHPVLGTIMVYGYSMTPVVVAAMVAAVPIKLVQVVSMGIAFTIGVLVILLNLWRDVGVEHRSLTYFVRGLAGVAHAGVGSGLIFMFYVHR
jgi:protein YIPF1/2